MPYDGTGTHAKVDLFTWWYVYASGCFSKNFSLKWISHIQRVATLKIYLLIFLDNWIFFSGTVVHLFHFNLILMCSSENWSLKWSLKWRRSITLRLNEFTDANSATFQNLKSLNSKIITSMSIIIVRSAIKIVQIKKKWKSTKLKNMVKRSNVLCAVLKQIWPIFLMLISG